MTTRLGRSPLRWRRVVLGTPAVGLMAFAVAAMGGWLPTVIVRRVLLTSDNLIFVYFVALNSFYLLLLALSVPQIIRHWRMGSRATLRRLLTADAAPPISLLVPAYNEEVTIVESVRSFLALEYPCLEIVVVNDGSQDGTLARLIAAYDLYVVPNGYDAPLTTAPIRAVYRSRRHPTLVVLDKANGGKADSLNAALNAARHPYVVAVDADTLVERDGLLRLARPFALATEVAAVSGTIRVANGCHVTDGRVETAQLDGRFLAGVQVVEYLRAFLFGRLGWNRLGGNLVISGAFGLFRRGLVLAIGGYATDSITEDMELVVRLHRHLRDTGQRDSVLFMPDPVAWTEVPTALRVLARQRERWHRGLIDTLVRHRALLGRPRYGVIGFVAMPYFVFGEMLAPLVEAAGYVITIVAFVTRALNPAYAIAVLAVAVLYGTTLTLLTVLLEEATFRRYQRWRDLGRLVGFTLLEPFGYRQLTVWFRLRAFWRYAVGDVSWGTMHREGFQRPASSSAPPGLT